MNIALETRIMNLRTATLSIALIAGSLWAIPSQDSLKRLESTLESIDSRRGLLIEGNIKSIYLKSEFVSDADSSRLSTTPDNERIGFSQLDLSLGVRPWEQTRGKIVMRLSAGYQDYFNAGAKAVSIPWMNLEGLVGNKFYWTVGDFRQSYSPLSLYSPDVEVLYEAEIFRRNRYMARDQVFLQDNQRNLQGANLQFRHEFSGMIGELRAEVLFSRLRRIEVLDFSGTTGNLFTSAPDMPGASQSAGMDKYLYTGNLELLPLNKSLLIGVTPIFIQDLESSRTGIYRYVTDPATLVSSWVYQPINPGVRVPENTQVINGRFGFDLSHFLKKDSMLTADVVAEYGMSKDVDWQETAPLSGLYAPLDREGTALLAQLSLGYQKKALFSSLLSVDYIMNDSNWFNPLAQSPAFFARRILNTDKDAGLMKYGALSPFYSTFDALYQYTPKYVPAGATLVADPLVVDQTESYNIAPMFKNSYSTGVYTRDELKLINGFSDQNLQAALPNGLATANRQGFQMRLTGSFQDTAVTMQAIFANFEEMASTNGAGAATTFNEMGGGLSVDVGHWLKWGLPIEFSGSFKKTTTEKTLLTHESSWINGGFYSKFHKRFGISFGYQAISTTVDYPALLANTLLLTKSDQMQWRVGLDYSLAKNTWLAMNYGMLNVSNLYDSSVPLNDPLLGGIDMMPDYIRAAIARDVTNNAGASFTGNQLEHQFDKTIIEVTINADF